MKSFETFQRAHYSPTHGSPEAVHCSKSWTALNVCHAERRGVRHKSTSQHFYSSYLCFIAESKQPVYTGPASFWKCFVLMVWDRETYGSVRSWVMKSELLKSRNMSLRLSHWSELFSAIQLASWKGQTHTLCYASIHNTGRGTISNSYSFINWNVQDFYPTNATH